MPSLKGNRDGRLEYKITRLLKDAREGVRTVATVFGNVINYIFGFVAQLVVQAPHTR